MTPDFSCERCQDFLPWYVANTLSADERAAVELHLDSCERCRVALEEWRAMASAIRLADGRIPFDTASGATWANISRRLDEQTALPYTTNERATMRLRDRHIPDTYPDTYTPADTSPAARPHRRAQAIAGLLAAAAIIALSVGVFSLFATRTHPQSGAGPTASPTTSHSACAPSKATANLPAHTILSAIAPLGTDDGWAVGSVEDTTNPSSSPSALILHLKNCHWSPVGTPIPHALLKDISMVTPDDGWAVGATMALNTTPLSNGQPANVWEADQPLVLHYTHGSWQTVQAPANPQTSAEKVKMVSASEGWMLLYDGKHPNGPNSLAYGYSLRHYQNGTWTDVPLSFRTPSMVVTDLDARQSGEVWLVGIDIADVDNRQHSFAAHYSHGTWTPYLNMTTDDLNSVSEVTPTDVWAAGIGDLHHFDGERWSTTSIPNTKDGVSGKFLSASGIRQIAMISPTQGWAFPSSVMGGKATQGIALRYDQGAWQWVSAPTAVFGFAAASPTQGWALHTEIKNGNDAETSLLYYDGGDWGTVRQKP